MTTFTPPAVERQDALHRLGTAIPEGLSIPEALDFAHMARWDVRTEALTAVITDEDGTPRQVTVDDKKAVLRNSPFTGKPEVLGIVGNRWTPFQNEDCAGLLADIEDMSGARLTTVGVMDGGRKTFLSMKMPEGMTFRSPRTGQTDITDLYLTVFNAHNGGGSLSAVITPVRPMCANQQRMSERSARSRFLLRHTGDAGLRMAQLREVLGDSLAYRHTFADQCNEMIGREMDEELARIQLEALFHATDPDLTERQRELRQQTVSSVMDLYLGSATVEPFRGTAYGVYNAVTEYTDHYSRVIVPEGKSEHEVRALRTLSDPMDDLKSRAFDLLVPTN